MAELTDQVDLSGWPEGTRLIVRKESPHPGASCASPTPTGTATSASSPTRPTQDIAALEGRHRLHARVEDRIQESQELGLGRLPFQKFAPNQAWLELALLAQDLLAWLRLLVLEGDLALAKPKRLRHRLLHVAGRLTRSGRRRTLHLPAAGPGATSSPPPSRASPRSPRPTASPLDLGKQAALAQAPGRRAREPPPQH